VAVVVAVAVAVSGRNRASALRMLLGVLGLHLFLSPRSAITKGTDSTTKGINGSTSDGSTDSGGNSGVVDATKDLVRLCRGELRGAGEGEGLPAGAFWSGRR